MAAVSSKLEMWFFKKTPSWTRKKKKVQQWVQSPNSSRARVYRRKAFLSLKPLLNNCKAANLLSIRCVLWKHASLISKSLDPLIWKPTHWLEGLPSIGPEIPRLGVLDEKPSRMPPSLCHLCFWRRSSHQQKTQREGALPTFILFSLALCQFFSLLPLLAAPPNLSPISLYMQPFSPKVFYFPRKRLFHLQITVC